MSSTPQFAELDYFEDSASATAALAGLEAALRPFLDEERERLLAEVEYLKEVYAGITGGADLEATSGLFVDVFLVTALAEVGFS